MLKHTHSASQLGNEVEAQPENLFTYTFIGRSPFNELLVKYCKKRHDGYDFKGEGSKQNRVKIVDHVKQLVSETLGSGNTVIEQLRQELTGENVNNASTGEKGFPGYMHTEAALSAPHGIGMRQIFLGEQFMACSNHDKAATDEAAVSGILSQRDANSIRITSKSTFVDFWYNPDESHKLTFSEDGEQKYGPFVEPHPTSNARPVVEKFLSAELTSEFTHRYTLVDVRPRPDIYEWSRRLDTYVMNTSEKWPMIFALANFKQKDLAQLISLLLLEELIAKAAANEEAGKELAPLTDELISKIQSLDPQDKKSIYQKVPFTIAEVRSIKLWLDAIEQQALSAKLVFFDNTDDIPVLNLVDLAEAYCASLTVGTQPDSLFNSRSLGSESTDSMSAFSPAKPSSSKSGLFSLGSSRKKVYRGFTDENPSFKDFENMEAWKAYLFNGVDYCKTQFPDVQNPGDTGALSFESNTIVLSPEIMHYATQTVQNIRADLYLRRARLTFIRSCLRDQSLLLWQRDENKIGLYETLLNELEHPLVALDHDEGAMISRIRNMRDGSEIFDYAYLIEVVNVLDSQAQQKTTELKQYCKNLKTLSPQIIFKKTKKLLRETRLVQQLRALAEHQSHVELTRFTLTCDSHLSAEDYDYSAFKEHLKEGEKQKFCSLVVQVIKLTLNIIRNIKKPYRENFLVAISAKELGVSENFDPFLMYAINEILEPRARLICVLSKVEELNSFYVLLKCCGSKNYELKKIILQDVIAKLESDMAPKEGAEKTIHDLILNFPVQEQKKLYAELCQEKLRCPSAIIGQYIQDLYVKIAEADQPEFNAANQSEIVQYFDARYQQALALPHGFKAFDTVTANLIKSLRGELGGPQELYLIDLFFRHFYVGMFFSDYLCDTPQEQEGRVFLYSGFQEKTALWGLKKVTLETINTSLRRRVRESSTSGAPGEAAVVYINNLEKDLCALTFDIWGMGRAHLTHLWKANFIHLCVWMAALVNRNSFSPDEIFYIYKKIESGLELLGRRLATRSSGLLLQTIEDAWRAYQYFERLSQRASDEWLNETLVISFVATEELYSIGQELFFENVEPETLKKTLWLNAAFQFFHRIKNSLQSGNRKSAKFFEDEVTSRKLGGTSATESEKRRSYVTQIVVMILTNKNISISQRKELQDFKRELFEDEAIRKLALDSILEQSKSIDRGGPEQRQYLMGFQVPDIVFFSQKCEMFVDPNFPRIVNDKLAFPNKDDVFTIAHFIENLLTALDCIIQLVNYSLEWMSVLDDGRDLQEKTIYIKFERGNILYKIKIADLIAEDAISAQDLKREIPVNNTSLPALLPLLPNILSVISQRGHVKDYTVFVPYLMEPIFTSLSVIYNYLAATQGSISSNILSRWSDCIQKIKTIGVTISDNAGNKCQEAADAWVLIQASVLDRNHLQTIDFNRDKLVDFKGQANVYDFILAYNVCLKLKRAGFKIDSTIKEIARQWFIATGYAIGSDEVKALNFILMDFKHASSFRQLREKRTKLLEFFMRNVEQVLRLEFVFIVLVSNSETLDKVTDDVKEIYAARLQGWRADKRHSMPFNYPVVFIYPSPRGFSFYRAAKSPVYENCIEIYQSATYEHDYLKSIKRESCSVTESYLLSRAGVVFPSVNSEPSLHSLEGIVSQNRELLSLEEKGQHFHEFFAILLKLLHNSMAVMQAYARWSPPISYSLLLKPSPAVYDDPRVLKSYKNKKKYLIGLFILGLIYKELGRQENLESGATASWLLNLPRFFADVVEGKKNMGNLGGKGIVASRILNPCFGSSGEADPVQIRLQAIDEDLPKPASFKSYCTWFKAQNATSQDLSSTTGSGNSSAVSLVRQDDSRRSGAFSPGSQDGQSFG